MIIPTTNCKHITSNYNYYWHWCYLVRAPRGTGPKKYLWKLCCTNVWNTESWTSSAGLSGCFIPSQSPAQRLDSPPNNKYLSTIKGTNKNCHAYYAGYTIYTRNIQNSELFAYNVSCHIFETLFTIVVIAGRILLLFFVVAWFCTPHSVPILLLWN